LQGAKTGEEGINVGINIGKYQQAIPHQLLRLSLGKKKKSKEMYNNKILISFVEQVPANKWLTYAPLFCWVVGCGWLVVFSIFVLG